MSFYVDCITLLDRTAPNVTASSDLSSAMTGTTTGDMTPWRIRLELTNTGETGVDNSGRLLLRVDDVKTFIKTGPILLNEDAKKKYLIDVKITQNISN